MTPHDPATLRQGIDTPSLNFCVDIERAYETHVVNNPSLKAAKRLTNLVCTEAFAIVALIKGP
jgi:hypothetical protein